MAQNMQNVSGQYSLLFEIMRIYDIHSHILPSVDDGPSDFSETIEIVDLCEQQGISLIVATPHRKDVSEFKLLPRLEEKIRNVNNYLENKKFDLRVLLGMENHLDFKLMDDIKNGSALTINGSKYILVEMPYIDSLGPFKKYFEALIESEYVPVIAHPERMSMFIKDPSLLWEFASQDVIVQVTAGSLYGRFGREVERFTKNIIRSDYRVVIASDTHMSKEPRDQDLTTGFRHAVSLVGQRKAREMVSDLPFKILNDD